MAITTNRDYLQKTLSRFNLSSDDVELIMVEYPELEGVFDVKACKLAIYNSMSAILPTANISEGGFSVSWNMDALKMWYAALCKELGKENVLGGKAKVRNRSYLW